MIRLLLCLSLLGLFGCESEKVLSFHVGGTAEELHIWEEIIQDFTKQNGIKVEMLRSTSQTEQRKQSLMVSLRGGKSDPDVMLVDVAWIAQMAASNWLAPLDTNIVSPSPFFASIIQLADHYNQQLIGVPIYVDGGILYYRKDLLEKYGFDAPPTTWAELIQMSEKVMKGERKSDPDFWGYVWQGAQYEGLICNALETFSSAGGGFFDSLGKPVVNSSENREALKTMVGMIQDSKISPPNTYTTMKEDEVRLQFQNGSALFERNWPYAASLHASEGSAVKNRFGMAPLPHFNGHESASTLGGWHAAVSRFSDQKEEALHFVNYISSFEVQKKLTLRMGYNPGRPDVYEDPEVQKKNPELIELKSIFKNAIPRPMVPYYSNVSQILQKHLNAALAGTTSPDDALSQAQSEVQAVVNEFSH